MAMIMFCVLALAGGEPLRFSLNAAGTASRAAGHAAQPLKILQRWPDGRCVVLSGNRVLHGIARIDGNSVHIDTADGNFRLGTVELCATRLDAMRQHLMKSSTATAELEIRNPIPGLVKAVLVARRARR